MIFTFFLVERNFKLKELYNTKQKKRKKKNEKVINLLSNVLYKGLLACWKIFYKLNKRVCFKFNLYLHDSTIYSADPYIENIYSIDKKFP